MPATGTVACRLVAKLLAGAGTLGADPRALLDEVGLDPAALADREGRVPGATVAALLRAAARQLGEEALGLRLAERLHAWADNVLRIAVTSSPTVVEAFRRFIRYSRIVHDAVEIRVLADGASARLRHRNPEGEERHGVELSLGLAAGFCRDATRGAFRLDEVCFAHAAPRDRGAHERFFAAPVRFDRPHNELVFPRALLDLPLDDADPALAAHLDRHLDAMLARAARPPSLAETVRRAIGGDLRGGVPRMEDVARRLRLSPRTLQRRLQDDGLSFQDLVAEVRRDLSARYLGATEMSLAEIAFLVGFSEASTFHRAFKHWTGVTPAEYRRRGP